MPRAAFQPDKSTACNPKPRPFLSDHYNGLSEAWNAGPIYCSKVTATLVSHICGVRPDFIRPLPMNEPVTVLGERLPLP